MDKKSLGRVGESYVCDFLIKKGYKILYRNFRTKFFEIDIIALKGQTINFIEVKTREDFEIKEHYKSINHFKLLKIKLGISSFLAKNPQFQNSSCQIKAIIVLINPYNKSPKFVFYDYLD